MSRPFPLRWGLAALLLFGLFAVVTQLQFSRLSNDKIYAARMDTYRAAERSYDVAIRANADCIGTIKTRETYREIFNGIRELFRQSADLPLELFPTSKEALAYQLQLSASIVDLIEVPVNENLPPKLEKDCPPIPVDKPTLPER